MRESDRGTLANIFAAALEICDQISELASATEADADTLQGKGLQIGRLAGELFRKLEKVQEIPDIPAEVFKELKALARIVRGTRKGCVSYGHVVQHLADNDMRPIAESGWRALSATDPQKQNLLTWADEETFPPVDSEINRNQTAQTGRAIAR